MNMDAGGDGVLASAELVKEAEANASYACKTQTLTDEDRSFVSSLWVQFGDEDDEDISTAMMDKISRRLEAMQSRLIVALQMAGDLLKLKEQYRGERGGGGGEGLRGADGTRRQVPEEPPHQPARLRPAPARGAAVFHIVHECVCMGPEQGSDGRVVGRISIIEFIIIISFYFLAASVII